MPHMENWKEFQGVGQDKADKEPVTVYDKTYGTYENTCCKNRPTTAGGSKDTHMPFSLKG